MKILATSSVTVGQDAIWVPPQCTRVISGDQLHQQALTCEAGLAWAPIFTDSAIKTK